MAKIKLNAILLEQERQKKLLESITLKEVVIKTKIKSPTQLLDEKYASGFFSGGDGISFDLSSDPFANGSLDILTYLQAKVAGLDISTAGAQPSATWRGSKTDFFLNEVNTQIETVQSLSIADIAYIKAIRPSVFKDFFNPSYEKLPENFEADNRTTLYWNPYVLTNKRNPRIRIEFYNNDISKKLQVVLEGMNSSGKLARVVKLIE